MIEEKLSKLDAYKAMYQFLKIQYGLSNDFKVKDLLSIMALTSIDPLLSADPAMWEDWEDAIKASKENPEGSNFKIID